MILTILIWHRSKGACVEVSETAHPRVARVVKP